jgi:hypothetical protein
MLLLLASLFGYHERVLGNLQVCSMNTSLAEALFSTSRFVSTLSPLKFQKSETRAWSVQTSDLVDLGPKFFTMASKIDWALYWPDIERLTKEGKGPDKISKYIEEKFKVLITVKIITKERNRRGLKTPTVNTYRKEVQQWRSEGVTLKEITNRIFERCNYTFNSMTISDALKRWSKEEEIELPENFENRGGPRGLKGMKVVLRLYKAAFMQWQEEGLSIEEMMEKFEETFQLATTATFVRKHLEFWNAVWIGIAQDQGWQHAPMDQRTDQDIQSLESDLKARYQSSYCPPGNILGEAWYHILVNAACYDRGIQGLIVKDFHQPGHHWPTSRLFDPLWVMGIWLPGSYCFSETDSREKIMKMVDNMTPAILEEVRKRLDSWLREGVKAACEVSGEEWLQEALSTTLATNPPMCVGRLLRIARSELKIEEQRTRVRACSAQVLGRATKNLYNFTGKIRQEPNTGEAFAAIVLEELKLQWRPETELGTLPPLTNTEMDMMHMKPSDLQRLAFEEQRKATDGATLEKLKAQLAAEAETTELEALQPFTNLELEMMRENPNDGDFLEDDGDGSSNGIEYHASEYKEDFYCEGLAGEQEQLLGQRNDNEQMQIVDGHDEETSDSGPDDLDESTDLEEEELAESLAAMDYAKLERRDPSRGRYGIGFSLKDELQRKAKRKGLQGYVHGPIFNSLYNILESRVRFSLRKQPRVFHHWMTPTTGALLGAPPARFGFEPWEPDRKSLMTPIVRAGGLGETKADIRARSICDARRLSRAEAVPANVRQKSQEVLDTSVEYARKIIAEQTQEEKTSYNTICKRMSECITRPQGAENLPYQIKWCKVARDDDWWHVRRLLQMLAFRYSMPKETHQEFELQLMLLLAAVEGGSTEAIMWVIGLEVVLGDVAQEVKSSSFFSDVSSENERKLQESLLQALATFVHSVAITNLVLRCHYRYHGMVRDQAQPTPAQKWYSSIYNTDPRCAHLECLRLLPHPSTVKLNKFRQTLSIGTWDARTGYRLARYFISGHTRLGPVYRCLQQFFENYEPHPILINAFLWYGELYHADSSCKAARGKMLQNF